MTSQDAMERIGIIAGTGRFPHMVLEGARNAGCHVTVVALRGFADESLSEHADFFCWAGMAKVGRWIRVLRRNEIRRVILAGGVNKSTMYGRFRMLRLLPDWTSLRIWFFTLRDKRNDTVLAAVADEFEKNGIIMEECIAYSKEHMAPEGVLTQRKPTSAQLDDAKFGWRIAKELGRLDIGQAVAVKETEIIAVEAIEGTDRMLERAGELCKQGGWSLIKVAKPDQDMRFDVPTVGPGTIANLKRHGAKMLVVEAGKTVIIDREQMIADAEAGGIVVLGQAGS